MPTTKEAMYTALSTSPDMPASQTSRATSEQAQADDTPYSGYQIIRRNGAVVPFTPT
ncbi:MAG: hypothetical protein H7224_00925, partial [Polaromonas sp.]|nr:hypothetical protein [Polaromonas sp.]